jgi:hypothetical protein
MPIYLRLDQHQVYEQHHEVMLHVFIREFLALWALCQAYTLSERAIVGFRVRGVEGAHRGAAGYAYRHPGW